MNNKYNSILKFHQIEIGGITDLNLQENKIVIFKKPINNLNNLSFLKNKRSIEM